MVPETPSQTPEAGTSASGVVVNSRSKSTMAGRTLRLAIVCVLGLIATDTKVCSTTAFEPLPEKTLSDTLRVLDRAMGRLGDPSSDYNEILQEAVGALPPTEQKARADIRAFLSRVPPTGPEFQCSSDFVRGRARYVLRRLRDTLLNDAPLPLEPAVCYASPFALDLAYAQSGETLVDIFGFDFDTVPLQMVLVDTDGYKDVTSGLTARSHYHLAFRVVAGGVAVTEDSQSLGLAWGHLIHYSIALVQPTTPLCSTQIEAIPAGKTASHRLSLSGQSVSAEAAGTISADASFDYSSNKLEATICATALDPALSGCTVEFLYTTDPDRVVDGVFGTLSSHTSFLDGRQREPDSGQPRSNLSGRWIVSGLQPGNSENGDASVTLQFNEILLVSTESAACISPIAYLEASRTNALDARTRQALDSQLRSIDPAILTLRPRFAPQPPR